MPSPLLRRRCSGLYLEHRRECRAKIDGHIGFCDRTSQCRAPGSKSESCPRHTNRILNGSMQVTVEAVNGRGADNPLVANSSKPVEAREQRRAKFAPIFENGLDPVGHAPLDV